MIVGGVRKFMVKASFGIPDYSSAYWPKLLGRTRTVMDKIAATKEVLTSYPRAVWMLLPTT